MIEGDIEHYEVYRKFSYFKNKVNIDLSHINNLSLLIDTSNRDLIVKIPYNKDFIAVIKTYITGRTWDSLNKFWRIPYESIYTAIQIFRYIRLNIPEFVNEYFSNNDNKIKLQPVRINRNNSDVIIYTNGCYDVVDIFRLLNNKKYNKIEKYWMIKINDLDYFLKCLRNLEYEIPYSLNKYNINDLIFDFDSFSLDSIDANIDDSELKEKCKCQLVFFFDDGIYNFKGCINCFTKIYKKISEIVYK